MAYDQSNMKFKLIARQDAILQGLTRYFTNIPCKQGHISERYTGNKTCCVCGNASANKAKDPNKVYVYNRDWRQSNVKKALIYTQKYVQKNRDKRNLWTANYRSAKDNRTPAWLTDFDKLKIEGIYSIAAMLTRENKEPWHVDHIIPLRGELVSGLHVPSNLQVIIGADNVRKCNQYAL